MIRRAEQKDISLIMGIWLEVNVKAHNFISPVYWEKNYELVESMMSEAEIYVYEKEEVICGFIGLMENYIAGLFVDTACQSAGMGKALLDYIKIQKEELFLHVYKKNTGALRFYIREGFVKENEQMDDENHEIEYKMGWHR